MKTESKKLYETFVDHGKLIFRITEGQFKDVEYTYNSLKLDGELKYKVKSHLQLNDLQLESYYKHVRPKHATLLVKNAEGLKNLYKIISHD